jgi:hypothetical protein
MPKKGELSKTARASLANRTFTDHVTTHCDPLTGERILLSKLFPVKVLRDGKYRMVYYDRDSYITS